MPFNTSFTVDLSRILEDLRLNLVHTPGGAVSKFETYLQQLRNLGSFNSTDWNSEWRLMVYEFGSYFKTHNPTEFFHLISESLVNATSGFKEVLEFLSAEIRFNYLPDNEARKHVQVLVENYPFNPEFRHNLGHFCAHAKDYLAAITQYKLAARIEPWNDVFGRSRFGSDSNYLNSLVIDGKYQMGLDHLKALLNENYYSSINYIYHNTLLSFEARFKDHLHFSQRLIDIERQFKERVDNELSTERRRIIEILGFF